MEFNDLYQKYEIQLLSLKAIVTQSQDRVLQEDPDELFSSNINFFVKSYLITTCTYLEAYLQDLAFEHATRLHNRLKEAKVPHNFIYWKLSKEVKEKELNFSDAEYKATKKDISDIISGNPYKTIKAFQYIGVDLNSNENFTAHKDQIHSIVDKRNSIIHHNDEASDITFSDLHTNIDTVLLYMKAIESTLSATAA